MTNQPTDRKKVDRLPALLAAHMTLFIISVLAAVFIAGWIGPEYSEGFYIGELLHYPYYAAADGRLAAVFLLLIQALISFLTSITLVKIRNHKR